MEGGSLPLWLHAAEESLVGSVLLMNNTIGPDIRQLSP